LPNIWLFSNTSGLSLRRVAIKITVTMPSAVPIMEWFMAMAGTAMLSPYHGDSGDKPISMPAAMAGVRQPRNVEIKIVAYNLVPILGLNSLFSAVNVMHGMNTPIMPMFKTLTPSAKSPPSPNSNACRTRIMDMEINPANGPNMSPMTAPPRRCAVVGPIMGKFIIMAAKKSAVSSPIMGTCCSVSLIFLNEIIQNMIVIMKAAIVIVGESSPSGICMFSHFQEW